MLTAGKLITSTVIGAVEARAASQALPAAGTLGRWRFVQSSAGNDKTSGTAAGDRSSSSSSSQTQSPSSAAPQPQQPRSPGTSAEARTLADQLRQASPTGRLFDLFSPSDTGPDRAGRGPRAPAAPSAPSTSASPDTQPLDTDVVAVVMRAVENCRPLMTVRQFKIGNRMTYVPRPLRPEASTKLAVKWIVQAASKRRDGARGSSASMAGALATELLLAYQRKGGARSKREELHKLALDNRANVRARWW